MILIRCPVCPALVILPALIRLANVRQVKGGGSVRRVWGYAGDTTLVSLAAVGGVALIPDVDWNLLSLEKTTVQNKNLHITYT